MAPHSAHNGPILAKGRGKGYPKISKKTKQTQTQRTNMRKNVFGEMWCHFPKSRRAQRLGIYCCIMKNSDKNDVYKWHTGNQKKKKMTQSASNK
jgi:hypothetical protein